MKKTTKRILVLAILVLVVVAFTACWRGDVSGQTTITSKDGAGTRTFVFKIFKNGVTEPKVGGAIITDNEWVDDTTGYLKGTNAQLVAKVLGAAPFSGITCVASETEEQRIFTIGFSFSSLADYNTKLEALYDAATGVLGTGGVDLKGDFVPATLSVVGDGVTFTDSWQSTVIGTDWAWAAVYGDSALIVKHDLTKRDMLYCEPLKVKVGGTTTTFGIVGSNGVAFADMTNEMVDATYSAQGTISATNPQTGDVSSIATLLAAIAAAGAAFALRTRKN